MCRYSSLKCPAFRILSFSWKCPLHVEACTAWGRVAELANTLSDVGSDNENIVKPVCNHQNNIRKKGTTWKGKYRSTPDIVSVIKSRRLRWAGHVARMEESRSSFRILTGTPAGKRSLGRPRRRCEDNIRMDLKEIGITTRNWVDLAQDRNYWRALVNAALNHRVP